MAKSTNENRTDTHSTLKKVSNRIGYATIQSPSKNASYTAENAYEPGMVHIAPKQPELIVNALAQYIVKSGMKTGDKLPAGKELSRILGVASCSLREALIILQTLGVIQARHGSGWYVNRFDPSVSFKLLSPIIENFSGMDIDEVMATRLANEPVIARLAAENITPELLEELHENLEGMKEKEDKSFWEDYRIYDKNFHATLAQACNNKTLAMISTILSGIHFSVMWWEVSGDQQTNYEKAIMFHQKIYDAVKNGDGKAAEMAMKEHMESAWDIIKNSIIRKRLPANRNTE